MPRFEPSRLTTLAGSELSVNGYRNQARGFDPRSGEGARRFGGRFNRPNSFAVVYLCTTRQCAAAELHRQAGRQGLAVEDLLPRELWAVRSDLTRVLDLTDGDVCSALGVTLGELTHDDLRLTREIGDAAHAQRFQAIRSASVTGIDDVIAILPDNLAGTTMVAERVEEWRSAADVG